jgi:glycosyltransferase involved in cell wall biosynthesis
MTTDAVGGVWTFATSLATGAAANGCEVTLVSLGPRPSAEQLRPVVEVDGIRVVTTDLELEWKDPAGRDFARAEEQLLALARQFRPDLVHLNSYREAAFHWRLPVVVTAHSCMLSWWDACRGDTAFPDEWLLYGSNVRDGLAHADLWTAPTVRFRDTIQSLYAPPRRGQVIHNGTPPLSSKMRKQPCILAAGRLWDEAKGIAALARVAPLLGWPLRIAGPTQLGDGSPQRGMAPQWLGSLPQATLLGKMQSAAIFVSPAMYEPFGLTVLEAAASGCALVLSDIPTLRELWNGAATFVPPNDDSTLVAAINGLIADQEMRTRMQRAAARRAAVYGLQTCVEQYLGAYAALTDAAAVPGLAANKRRLLTAEAAL